MIHAKHSSLLVLSLLLAACTAAPADNTASSSSASSSAVSSLNDQSANIVVTAPLADDLVSSPMTISGQARGTWYFEASFPVRLFDANGLELAVSPAQAQGEWMTEDFVPFELILSFPTPTTATGTLVLEKDNPSGEPANAASVVIPVRFE